MVIRICRICGVEFVINASKQCYCPNCREIGRQEYLKQYRLRNRGRRLLQDKIYAEINKEKVSTRRKLWKIKNREEIRKKNAEYRIKNKLKIKEQNKLYYQNNRDKVNKSANRWQKYKYHTDPAYKLKNNISSSIGQVLRNKNFHSFDVLGYDSNQLKEHLEKQFTPEMNWDNYGSYWHIDHIIPVSLFNWEKRNKKIIVKKCWSLDNLRPLEAKDNRVKSNKLFI